MTKQEIIELYEDDDMLFADGFDDCIIGITSNNIVVYDTDKMISVLIKDGMSYEDAIDHWSFNIEGAYVGERTPIYMTVFEEAYYGKKFPQNT